ncbi:DUF2510 domain-containing protein [Ilumatobacter sp.]|uniref:DUF2510 domain-containing protein n=1 Tax=Ilumatobacter sp. TaxID=1967498 RepID=UPI003B523C9F
MAVDVPSNPGGDDDSAGSGDGGGRGQVVTAGWYPDPAGDHELRYHNGVRWTGDVSTDGDRSVGPLDPSWAAAAPSRGSATAPSRAGTVALACGVAALTIGWIPFACALGAILAVIAIVAGVRARRDPRTSGAGDAGLVTGIAALGFVAAGTWFSVALVQAVARFEDPGAHRVEIVSCARSEEETTAVGEVENLEGEVRSYVIEVEFAPEGPESLDRTASVEVDDVEPGGTRSFTVVQGLRYRDLDCTVSEVTGPAPLGLDLDR